MLASVRRITAVLLILCAAGCSTPGRAVTTEPPANPPRRSLAKVAAERARPAYRAFDRTTECVGRVIYPIALVAAFPAFLLAGGNGGGFVR